MRRILVVTGDRGTGKSTLCEKLAQAVSHELGPDSVRGVVTQRAENGDRYAVLYPGGEKHLLATKRSTSALSDVGRGPRVGPFHFSPALLDLVNAHFGALDDRLGHRRKWIKLWLLDEVGPLELARGSGFLPAFRALVRTVSAQKAGTTAVVVVRPELIAEVESRIAAARFAPEMERVYLTAENRDAVASDLTDRVLDDAST